MAPPDGYNGVMTIIVRPATMTDHASVNRVSAESAALHARAHPERFVAASDALPADHFRHLLDTENSEVYVAVRDGDVVGYATVQLHETRPYPVVRPRRFAVIDEISVAESVQRQGIGRLLIDAVLGWARDRNASAIELNVFEFNEAAIAFYEDVGFTPIARRLALPLGGRDDDPVG